MRLWTHRFTRAVRLRGAEQGVAAVELGLLLPVLLTLAFGVTELGRAAYEYNTITKGVRDAARFLTTVTPGGTSNATAACLVRRGNPACTGNLLLPGLAGSTITIQDSVTHPGTHSGQPVPGTGGAPGAGSADLVTITVTGYVFQPLITYVVASAIPFGPIRATFIQQ
jgi:Flp pilus assembly protein TadG